MAISKGIDSAEVSNFEDDIGNFEVVAEDTDGIQDQKETEYLNTKWSTWFGYYKIPRIKSSIEAARRWTMGKGYDSFDEDGIPDESTILFLDTIDGNGKQTFLQIIGNVYKCSRIGGDGFAEKVPDPDKIREFINLIVKDPSTIKIISNRQGRIIRYELISKIKGTRNKRFKPNEMFHLPRNMIADEAHGTSDIESIEETVKAIIEAEIDWKRVLHRNVDPLIIWHLNTDKKSKIDPFITTVTKARKTGENIFLPKLEAEVEVLGVAPNATLNPVTWIDNRVEAFYENFAVPKIVTGNSKAFTEASSKIGLLSYEQTWAEDQLELEEQILTQLNISIKFRQPASLQGDLISGKQNEDGVGVNTPEIQDENAVQPKDVTAEGEGTK